MIHTEGYLSIFGGLAEQRPPHDADREIGVPGFLR
jgi:hypothetical protein